MSVYTEIDAPTLETFLLQYDLGPVVALEGIRAGIENTNYFLDTETGRYVLTIFETLAFTEVPLCLALTHFLATRGVPCADPVAGLDGAYVYTLLDKPTCIVSRLAGISVDTASVMQLISLGQNLARWHAQVGGFHGARTCRYGPLWQRQASRELLPLLPDAERELLQQEITIQATYQFSDLPHGMIHSDLFRDNVLFEGDRLSGIIDVYDACDGPFLYDLAVVCNDWCRDPDVTLNREKTRSLLESYHQVRRLSALERGAWPMLLRRAALRFWLSRLQRRYQPLVGKLTWQKNPDEFKQILQCSIARELDALDAWPRQ